MRFPNIGGITHAQKVAVTGVGNVGTELMGQILKLDQVGQGHKHPTAPLIVANSKRILLPKAHEVNGILDGSWKDRLQSEGEINDKGYDGIISAISQLGLDMSEVVFIDTTADDSSANLAFYKRVIGSGGQFVTANKASLAYCSMADFRELTKNRRKIGYRASVMAGGPAVGMIQDAYDTRNPIIGLSGCFSGTLAIIPSKMEEGMSFSEAVGFAVANNYAEPDPRQDLSGKDVGKKIVILTRSGNYEIEMDDIIIEPFIPEEYFQYSGEEFMEKIKELDVYFKERIESLTQEEKVLRYVAEMKLVEGHPKVTVGLREVEKNSKIGSLEGTTNIVILETLSGVEYYARPGAGVYNTANSLRGDISRLLVNGIV